MKDPEIPSVDLGANSFRILVEAVADYAIYMLDAEGRVATWNTGAQRFKGYHADEIVGRHFSQFYSEEDRRNGVPQRALQIAAETGKFEAEGWRMRKDGSRFWAHVVIDPIRDSSGALIGYAKITRDLTERREVQAKLEQTREALIQSQKMESLGQLTGGVAHDFNNLLTAIIGSLELIERRVAGDPRSARLVANAMQAARRGAGLTQRMLAFARRQELTPTAVDLRGLLAGMEELLDRSLGASASLVIDTPPDLPPVHADEGQVEMALLNLALNARDAMPNGGPIVIAARAQDLGPAHPLRLPPGRYVGLSVRDQGTGMDAATLARAAEPFFTTKGVGKGTGLGLAMVHGLAEQLGGRLDLESAPGRGTTATLWLPVSQESAAAAAADPGGATGGEGRTLRILAVDDDALVLLNTAMMLEESGHTVQTAYSAAEALAQLENRSFDLLVTDQGMPGTTGLELIAAARARHPGMRALLVTGYAELPAGLPHGIERLAKPFHETHLADAVARVMRDEPQ